MLLKKIAFSVFLLCSFALTARSQAVENGGPDELKGVKKIYVDARTDASVREKIISEIRKKLRAAKRELIVASAPEESDIHLRFHFEWETFHGEGGGYSKLNVKVPVGTVVKILGKDRVRLLMSYSFTRPNFVTGGNWDKGKHDVEFAREFAQAYLAANPLKQGQPARLASN